jgi:hypothetical protein
MGDLVCLFCNCYFACVEVWVFLFGGLVKGIGGSVLTLVARMPALWLLCCACFRIGVSVWSVF